MEKTALISVSDKSNILDFARKLIDRGWQILSTGGTYTELLKLNTSSVINISDYTGFPEILGGRVKTLLPNIHGGILMRRDNNEDKIEVITHDIDPIDMVVVNLYPFEQAVEDGKDLSCCIDNIDIGGVALLRAASKNYRFVTAICDPSDYDNVIGAIDNDILDVPFRFRLAYKVFSLTSAYDLAIKNRMEQSMYPILA